MLEHRQHEEVVEPEVDELGPVDRFEPARAEDTRPLADLAVPRYTGRLRQLPPVHVVVARHDAEDPVRAVAEVEHECRVKVDEVAEPRGIEPARRVREANVVDRAGHVRQPRVNGSVGKRVVRREIAEEVEGQRRRPQEIGPQALMVEALVPFDGRRPRSRRLERVLREEGGSGLARIVEGKTPADRTRRLSFAPDDRLGADRVSACLPPARLDVAQPPPEVRQLRAPRHVVFGLPAVRGLELLPGENVLHLGSGV